MLKLRCINNNNNNINMFGFNEIIIWAIIIALIILFVKVSNLKRELEFLKRNKIKNNELDSLNTIEENVQPSYVVVGGDTYNVAERTPEEKIESEFHFGSK
jgi:hypothetical protein